MADNRPYAHYLSDEALQDQAAVAVRKKQAEWEQQTEGKAAAGLEPQTMAR